jgi:hypothetical protein
MLRRNEQGGVWKWVLIGVLVVILLACVGGFFGLRYLRHQGRALVTGVAVNGLKMQIERNLPAGYDRAKVEETFQGLEQELRAGKVKSRALGPIGNEIGDAMKDGKLTSEELDKILEDIKKLSAPSTS